MISTHSSEASVDAACASLAEWLRVPHRDPALPTGQASEVAAHFLARVRDSGFTLELVNDGTTEAPKWVGHWAYRGSQLEGFKQPPYQSGEDDARIHACAALLRNEWCRSRIP